MRKFGRMAGVVGLSAFVAGGEMQRPPSSEEQPRSISVESAAQAAPPEKPAASETPAKEKKPVSNKAEKIGGPKARRFKEILEDKDTPAIDRLRELAIQLKGTIQTRIEEKAPYTHPPKFIYRREGEGRYVWEVIDAMFKLHHSTPGPQRKELRDELEEYAKYFRREKRTEVANEIEERVMERRSPRQKARGKRTK